MALVADCGALYALYDASDENHEAAVSTLQRERSAIYVPTVVLAELDYLLRENLGIDAELDLLEGIRRGLYSLEALTAQDLDRCVELITRYRNLDLGLADASVVATAERLGIERIFTVDQRDFRVIRSRAGQPFTLLPADAQS
jgi:hypothetical protein